MQNVSQMLFHLLCVCTYVRRCHIHVCAHRCHIHVCARRCHIHVCARRCHIHVCAHRCHTHVCARRCHIHVHCVVACDTTICVFSIEVCLVELQGMLFSYNSSDCVYVSNIGESS